MQLPDNIVECTSLEIVRNIPKELTFFKNQCHSLKRSNQHYQKALIGIGVGVGLYILLKTIDHYMDRENTSQSRSDQGRMY